MPRSVARSLFHSDMLTGTGLISSSGRRTRISAVSSQALTQTPQPTHLVVFTLATVSTLNAPNWQYSTHSPQAVQISSSTVLTKAELATTLAIPISAMPRKMPQEQVQQLQIYQLPFWLLLT